MDIRLSVRDAAKALVETRSYKLSEIHGEPTDDADDEQIFMMDDGAPCVVVDGIRRCGYCRTDGSHYMRCPYFRLLRAVDEESERVPGAMSARTRRLAGYGNRVRIDTAERRAIERIIRELTDRASDDMTVVHGALSLLRDGEVYRYDWPGDHQMKVIDARSVLDMVNRMVTPDADAFAKDQTA